MLDDNLDSHVGSISLLPWKVSYDPWSNDVWFAEASNFDVVLNEQKTDYVRDNEDNPIKKPVLLELDRQDNIIKKFKKPEPADTKRTEETNAAAKAQIGSLSETLAGNSEDVTDDVKNAAVELVEAQNKAIEAADGTDDAKTHEHTQQVAEANTAEAQHLEQVAEQQATAAAQAAIENTATEAQKEAKKEVIVQDWT